MGAGIGTDYGLVRKVRDSIGKHSLLDPDSAFELAKGIVEDLEFTSDTQTVRGADYLGGLTISRWSTPWMKRT